MNSQRRSRLAKSWRGVLTPAGLARRHASSRCRGRRPRATRISASFSLVSCQRLRVFGQPGTTGRDRIAHHCLSRGNDRSRRLGAIRAKPGYDHFLHLFARPMKKKAAAAGPKRPRQVDRGDATGAAGRDRGERKNDRPFARGVFRPDDDGFAARSPERSRAGGFSTHRPRPDHERNRPPASSQPENGGGASGAHSGKVAGEQRGRAGSVCRALESDAGRDVRRPGQIERSNRLHRPNMQT